MFRFRQEAGPPFSASCCKEWTCVNITSRQFAGRYAQKYAETISLNRERRLIVRHCFRQSGKQTIAVKHSVARTCEWCKSRDFAEATPLKMPSPAFPFGKAGGLIGNDINRRGSRYFKAVLYRSEQARTTQAISREQLANDINLVTSPALCPRTSRPC